MLAMAICYSANIGGTGTLVGTGANVILSEYLNELDGNPVSFGTWMAFSVPQMILCLVAAWCWLYFYFIGISSILRRKRNRRVDKEKEKELQQQRNESVSRVIRQKFSELGPMTFHEGVVVFVFLIAFNLWFFLSPGFMTGWGDLLESTNAMGEETNVDDATPAILIALLVLALPAKPTFLQLFRCGRKPGLIQPSPPVIDWKTAQHNVSL